MKELLKAIAIVLMSVGISYAILHQPVQAPKTGAYNPTGGGTYRLQSSVASTDTSITLTSFKEPVSNILYTMTYLNSTIEYATLDPQTTTKEFISFTGITQNSDGSATLTGVIRGLSFSSPYTASSTFQQAHSGQSILILSNPPQLTNSYLNLFNDNSVYGINSFSSTSPPRLDQPGAQAAGTYIATTSEFASIAYVNAISIAGASNATAAVKGILQLATGLQAGSSTLLGSTGASLALSSGIATDTPSTPQTVSGSKVVISAINGFIKQAWLDLSATWAFTGNVTIPCSAAKTCTLNSIAYKFPNILPTASSSVMASDTSGNLSWINAGSRLLDASTTLQSVAGSSSASTTLYSFLVPANTLGTTGVILAHVVWGDNSVQNTGAIVIEFAYGAGTTTLSMLNGTAGTVDGYGYTDFIIKGAGTTGTQSTVVTYTEQPTGYSTTYRGAAFESTKSITTDSTAAQYLRIIARTPSAGGSDIVAPVAVTLQSLP